MRYLIGAGGSHVVALIPYLAFSVRRQTFRRKTP
jgi:hypothetical protein